MAAYGASIADSVTGAVDSVRSAQRALADTILEGQKAVSDAIDSAKQNLNSIGTQLADAIGNYLDKIQGSTDAASETGVTLTKRAKAELADLQKAIAAGVATPELEARAKALQSQLEQRAGSAGGTTDTRKEKIKRDLADITDLYNKHAISRETFEKRITAVLRREGITRENIRKRLGIAAADEFTALLKGLGAQATALRAGPQAPGTGLAVAIVRPLEALRVAQRNDLDARKALADTQNQLTKAEIEQQKLLTAELKKFRGKLRAEGFTKEQTQGKATGGPVSGPAGTDTVPAMLTAGEIVFNASQQQNLRGMLGVRGGGPGDLFHHVARGRGQRFAEGGVAGRIPLGPVGHPHVSAAFDHRGPRDYRWRDFHHERVPMRRDIHDWAADRYGRGVSPAAGRLGADWWGEQWPRQQRFGVGGFVKSAIKKAWNFASTAQTRQRRHEFEFGLARQLTPELGWDLSLSIAQQAWLDQNRKGLRFQGGGVADRFHHDRGGDGTAPATRRDIQILANLRAWRTESLNPVSARQASSRKLAEIPISEEDRIRFYANQTHASPKQTQQALDWYHDRSVSLQGQRFIGALGWATAFLPIAGRLGVRPGEVMPLQSPLVHEAVGPMRGLPPKGGPSAEVQAAAAAYMRGSGLPYNPPRVYSEVNARFAGRVARAYERMHHAPGHPVVAKAYGALAKETIAQYHALVGRGFKFEFYPRGKDPYPSPWDAMRDLQQNKHLYVYPTEAGYGMEGAGKVAAHPLLADSGIEWGGRPATVNDIFRGVHDVFGHFKEGVGFRAAGEENAFRQHAAMFSPTARRALASETRGQNSWVNFGPKGKANRGAGQAETVYAEQKAALLPWWALKFQQGGVAGSDTATGTAPFYLLNNQLKRARIEAAHRSGSITGPQYHAALSYWNLAPRGGGQPFTGITDTAFKTVSNRLGFFPTGQAPVQVLPPHERMPRLPALDETLADTVGPDLYQLITTGHTNHPWLAAMEGGLWATGPARLSTATGAAVRGVLGRKGVQETLAAVRAAHRAPFRYYMGTVRTGAFNPTSVFTRSTMQRLGATLADERGSLGMTPEERAARAAAAQNRRDLRAEIERQYRDQGQTAEQARESARKEINERRRVRRRGPLEPSDFVSEQIALQKITKARFLPPQVKGAADLHNLMLRLGELLREGLPFARHWYGEGSEALVHAAGGDLHRAEKYAALAAIFSPQQAVVPNIGLAFRAARQLAKTGEIEFWVAAAEARGVAGLEGRGLQDGVQAGTEGAFVLRQLDGGHQPGAREGSRLHRQRDDERRLDRRCVRLRQRQGAGGAEGRWEAQHREREPHARAVPLHYAGDPGTRAPLRRHPERSTGGAVGTGEGGRGQARRTQSRL